MFYILATRHFQPKKQGNISWKIKVLYHRPLTFIRDIFCSLQKPLIYEVTKAYMFPHKMQWGIAEKFK